ncbi:transmembrane protein 33 [Notothenia coriiceps]|uniref:Transmembrane protein 33 n=1 Tax=Notothenia coriiceps TaxID=8208 RepID=A0A6I9P683_9TELE|nr:PREDICTED: transmembrane protein 33 [Notothenia coriiceps]
MADTNEQSPPPPPPQLGPVQFLMSNKLETAMWLSRLFTVYCSVMFILPILGPYAAANFYQRALLANALTSALRLHQRLPRFQLSRAFLAQALQEDSCHYLLYSLILVNSHPITSILYPSNMGKRQLDSAGGQGSLLLPFIYYRFLTLRYTSRRNPYCRTLFTELRILMEHFIMKPACPAFFRKACLSSIAFISRLAPTGV